MPAVTFEVVKKPMENRLIDAACIYWDVSTEYLKLKSDKQVIVYRRKILYYLLVRETALSLRDIAALFGFECNGTRIRRAVEELEGTQHVYPQIKEDIEQVRKIAAGLDAQVITLDFKLKNFKN